MVNINPNWNRWIFASASSYFKGIISPQLLFVVEGQQRREEGDYIEFRMTGPTWIEMGLRDYQAEIVINILVKAVRDERDNHKIFRMAGIVEAAFPKCFPIKKFGNQVGDDPSVTISVMSLIRNGLRDIETINYGQIAPDVPSIQATVEANYRCDLTNNE